MKFLKLFLTFIFLVGIFVFIILGVWLSITKIQLPLFSHFYWLVFIGFGFIAFIWHLSSSIFFLTSILFFIISFSISAIGLSNTGEFFSKVNFVVFTVALIKAIVEYTKRNNV